MTPPTFSIGDEVLITGQNVHNNSCRLGQRFVIEQIIIDKKYGTMYSAPGQLGFPASSLRLVEELKIGDGVEVIGTCSSNHDSIGKIKRISHIYGDGDIIKMTDGCHYYRKDLRKLTPEEIKQHIAPKLELDQKTKVKIGMALLKHLDRISEMQDRLSAIEKRLAFVEKIQRDQDDLIGRAIRDGVVEILDFRRKA